MEFVRGGVIDSDGSKEFRYDTKLVYLRRDLTWKHASDLQTRGESFRYDASVESVISTTREINTKRVIEHALRLNLRYQRLSHPASEIVFTRVPRSTLYSPAVANVSEIPLTIGGRTTLGN